MKGNLFNYVVLLFAALIGLALTGCGPVAPTPALPETAPPPTGPSPAGPTSPPETEEPSGAFTLDDLAALEPGDILLQKDFEPTFFRIETMVPYGRVPSFTLYADGTLVYLQEGQSFGDEVLMSVQLSPEETVELLNQALELGLPRLESHLDFCENPGGEGMCIADAAYTILRGRLPSGALHEVTIYANFANDLTAFESVSALLEEYQHPEAEPYQPHAATLFFSPMTGAEGAVYEWPFGPELPSRGSQEQPWAAYLEGEDLSELLDLLPRNMGDFLFEHEGRTFNVYLVPWLPYADFREAIEADFPTSSSGEGSAGIFSTCPVPQASAQGSSGPLRLIYSEGEQLLFWDEGVNPVVLNEAEGIEEVRLSPDGDTAVYATQPGGGPVQLWAISLDKAGGPEEPRPLAEEGQLTGPLSLADFSPDGQLIAFNHRVGTGSAELWSARLDGSGTRRLVSVEELRAQFDFELEPQGVSPFSLAWIPRSQQLVYGAFPHYEEGIFIYIPDQVNQVGTVTGQSSQFLPPGSGGELNFSPDGTKVAILRVDSLSLYDLEAGGQPLILNVPYHAIGFGEYYYYPPVEWAADSSKMLVALPQEREYTPSGLVSVWEVPVDGSPPVELAQSTGFAPTYEISPDLSRMAYWYALPEENNRELHLANVDGSEDVVYTSSFLVDFVEWSPDSQRFVYTTGGSEDPHTWLGDICADPVELADYLPTPHWLGGDRLLLTGDRDGVLQLAQANFAGEYTLLLTPEVPGSYDFVVLHEE